MSYKGFNIWNIGKQDEKKQVIALLISTMWLHGIHLLYHSGTHLKYITNNLAVKILEKKS